MVAWAHGTTGEADTCAPSLGGYDPEYLSDWLARGYVVTATDYEGLGTPGLHPYLVGESEGRGVLDSLRAALAMPETGAANRSVIFGHSQGGHAALFANELAPTYAPELHVLGTVAAAPASQLLAAWSIATSGPVVRSAVIMMGAGLATAYPSLDLADIYTPLAISKLGVVDTGCQQDVVNAYAALSQTDMIHALPADVPAWKSAVSASEPGFRVGAGPVLIVHGTADEEVPYEASLSLSQRLCSTGQFHDFVTFEGQNHSGIFGPGRTTILGWVDARFAGTAAADLCTGGHAPLTPGPGECAPSGPVTSTGLDTISGPAVSQVRTTPTAIGNPFSITATATIDPGGTITYTARTSAELGAIATHLLEDQVRPVVREQYGAGLAGTAWVVMQLDHVTLTAKLPVGTSPVGEPVVSGADPPLSAAWTADAMQIVVPTITLDSRRSTNATTTVTWTVRDNGTPPPATIELWAGPLTVELTLTIGVLFFGAPLTGGITAPFSCLPAADALAETSVLAAAVAAPATPATVVVATPALAG